MTTYQHTYLILKFRPSGLSKYTYWKFTIFSIASCKYTGIALPNFYLSQITITNISTKEHQKLKTAILYLKENITMFQHVRPKVLPPQLQKYTRPLLTGEWPETKTQKRF